MKPIDEMTPAEMRIELAKRIKYLQDKGIVSSKPSVKELKRVAAIQRFMTWKDKQDLTNPIVKLWATLKSSYIVRIYGKEKKN